MAMAEATDVGGLEGTDLEGVRVRAELAVDAAGKRSQMRPPSSSSRGRPSSRSASALT